MFFQIEGWLKEESQKKEAKFNIGRWIMADDEAFKYFLSSLSMSTDRNFLHDIWYDSPVQYDIKDIRKVVIKCQLLKSTSKKVIYPLQELNCSKRDLRPRRGNDLGPSTELVCLHVFNEKWNFVGWNEIKTVTNGNFMLVCSIIPHNVTQNRSLRVYFGWEIKSLMKCEVIVKRTWRNIFFFKKTHIYIPCHAEAGWGGNMFVVFNLLTFIFITWTRWMAG